MGVDESDGKNTSPDSSVFIFCFISSLAFVLCISRIQVQVNSNNISNTQDRVSIDAGLMSVEADRVLWLTPVRTRKE